MAEEYTRNYSYLFEFYAQRDDINGNPLTNEASINYSIQCCENEYRSISSVLQPNNLQGNELILTIIIAFN